MNTHVLLFTLLLASFSLPVRGQQPHIPSSPTKPQQQQQDAPDVERQDVVRITTNLVQIDVVVTKDGKAVTDLQAEDFDIFEDGKPQKITNFSYISNVPAGAPAKVVSAAKPKDKTAPPVPPAKINVNDQRRTVALVVDDMGISFESMARLRGQIRKFIAELAPNDLVAIIRTGGDVGSLQQFTNDKRVLQGAADHLRWNPCSRSGLYVFQPAGAISNTSICSQPVSRTLNSLRFILKGMSYLPGRKSLVIFSDYLPIENQEPYAFEQSSFRSQLPGDDGTQTESDNQIPDSGISYLGQLQRIAELAIRSSVVIYAVDTRGLQPTGLTAADRLVGSGQAMQDQINSIVSIRSADLLRNREGSELIAKQSGGFLIRNSNDFGLQRVMEDQQGYYLIGFRPAEETFNRNFHRIKAKLRRGGMTIRTRAGFYGFTDEEARPPQLSTTDLMNRALISPFGAREVHIRLTSFYFNDPEKGPLLRSFLYLDPRDVTFTEQANGWQATNLEIRGLLFGDNGRVLGQQDQTGSLRFRGARYERALREGLTYGFDIPVKLRGAFQFRVAVLDVNTSRIGAAGQFVEIPDLRDERLALSGIVAREMISQGNASTETTGEEGVKNGPAVRQFRQGANVTFAFAIYNANVTGRIAELTTQIRVFSDGKVVFTGTPSPLSLEGQPDPQRITTALRLQLGSEMIPGDYVFQVIVTDSSNKDKPRVGSQWIDFEIVR